MKYSAKNFVVSKTLPHTLAVIAMCAFWSTFGQSVAAETDKPNIVLIISDDQGWTDYGFMGHAHVEPPILMRWHDEARCSVEAMYQSLSVALRWPLC